MNRKSIYLGVLFLVVLSSLIFILGLDRKDYIDTPSTVYQVYLDGEIIGIIEDEDELYDLIDKTQESLKRKFGVKKIYAPLGLETTKLVTYTGKLNSVDEIYEKIKDVKPFTVKGYEVTIIHGENNIETFNILKKEDFDTAIDTTIKAFVNEEQYQKYLESKQDKITTTGNTIQDISLREEITIKEKYISTEDKIFTNSDDLSRFILFGTEDNLGVHIVRAGETIKEIANEYELNVRELLIVNPNIINEKALLYAGQELNIGLINPKVSVIVKNLIVEDRPTYYKTEIQYDNMLPVGTTYTSQAGQNGVSRVTYTTESINGIITQLNSDSSKDVVISEPTTEIIVKGGLSTNNPGDLHTWHWPTLTPYVITEYFGWRFDPIDGAREFHNGIDISGTGYGSNIYAANRGVITQIGYNHWSMGNNIWIDHGSGYQTVYMHLADFSPDIFLNKEVEAGEIIGYMGSTGWSTGTHLDFRISLNGEYLDPLGDGIEWIY